MRIDLRSKLNDRERILLHVIEGMITTEILCRASRDEGWAKGSEAYRNGDNYYVHLAPWDKPKPGDLVIGRTGGIGEWKIAWYVSEPPADNPNGEFGVHVVREIGTGRLCNYGNESFIPIRGLRPEQLFERQEKKFYFKVLRAFARGGEDWYRYGGLKLDGEGRDRRATIRIREKFGTDSQPFSATLAWNGRTSVQTILNAMIAAGYGTHKFQKIEKAI